MKHENKPKLAAELFFWEFFISLIFEFFKAIWDNQWIYSRLIGIGESATLGRRTPWANRLYFKKYERKNLEFFTWNWENDFGNLCPSLIGKIEFLFFKI